MSTIAEHLSQPTAGTFAQKNVFFSRVAAAAHRVIFLDYDGTLAPFVTDRRRARPFPGIMELVALVRDRGTRIVIVSGRVAADVLRLLDVSPPFEVWGSHGFERVMPTGESHVGRSVPAFHDALSRAHEAFVYEGIGDRVESKPSGIAVHWRGLTEAHACEVATIAERILVPITDLGASLANFDGGLELRARGYDKGHVVRTVMGESPAGTIAAFLGDDFTDEDGFRAVRPYGVGVLVRDQLRPTDADYWIRPPAELSDFLKDWCAATEGGQR